MYEATVLATAGSGDKEQKQKSDVVMNVGILMIKT